MNLDNLSRSNYFVLKVWIVMLAIMGLFITTGIFAYNKFTDAVSSIQSEVVEDYSFDEILELRKKVGDVEIDVKSFRITRDSLYLNSYQSNVQKLDSLIRDLESRPYHLRNDPLIIHFDSLINEKTQVLDEILSLSDRNRTSELLEKLLASINQYKNDSSSSGIDGAQNRLTLFQRIFSKNKRTDSTTQEVEESFAQLEEEIVNMNEEDMIRESELRSLELALIIKDQRISSELDVVVEAMRKNDQRRLENEAYNAHLNISVANKQILVFFFVIFLLVLTLGYFVLSYVNNNRKYKEALSKTNREAQELAKTKEVFLANISHEIRTPLNAISGFTEQLLQSDLSEEQKEQMNIIAKSSSYLLHLINDVLDYTKLQLREVRLENEAFAPQNLLNELQQLFQPEFEAKGIKLKIEWDKKLPESLSGDMYRFRQVLLNLINNAMKFTEKGGVRLKIDGIAMDEVNYLLKIKISDTGIGMTEEQLENVFQEFVQAETSTARKYGGSGLGLPIVKEIVQLMGGTIKLKSKPKIGTNVFLELPFKIASKEEVVEKEEIGDVKALEDLRILAVDDEQYNRDLLQLILKKWGVKFDLAAEGNEALHLAGQNTYDIILMDMRMPDLSGIEVTKAIRSMNIPSTNAKIIALTAAVSITDRLNYSQAGMDGFLPKPFKENQLIREINRVLNSELAKVEESNDVEQKSSEEEELNFKELLKVCNDDLGFYADMLRTFIETTTNGMDSIKVYLKENDKMMIGEQAHKISSPCKHMGADQLYDLFKKIEKLSNTEGSLSAIEKLYEEAVPLFKSAVSSVENELNRVS